MLRFAYLSSSLLALALVLPSCNSPGSSAEAPSPIAAAELQREAGSGPVRDFYAALNWQPVWTPSAAESLRKAIAARAAHGLDRLQFNLPQGEVGAAAAEVALTRAALAYAAALARGATDPAKLYEIYTVPRPQPNLPQGLIGAIREGRVDAWLAGLAPQDAAYAGLSRAYLALREESAAAAAPIPQGEPIKPGARDPRLPVIARQLIADEYLANEGAEGLAAEVYGPRLVAAVKALQADYGIKPDGVIGADTLAILNLTPGERARAIAVALERLRWLERTPPATRVDVNIAAQRLSYWRDGKLVDSRRVVVGEPENKTPQLGSPMFRLVANPTWTVPRSIQNKEIAGKGQDYLRRNNMAWKNGWIVQQPGPRNSLGLVKFDMKNEHAIYLHDTPAKELFKLSQRARSHGCVRVEDALGFAAMLARDEGIAAQWNAARASGKESFVPLPREIPVRLLYHTVLIDDAGQPVVRADPYDWNPRVAQALGFPAGASAPRLHTRANDVGP